MAKCYSCSETNIENFTKDKSRASGLSSRCKACNIQRIKDHNEKSGKSIVQKKRSEYRKKIRTERCISLGIKPGRKKIRLDGQIYCSHCKTYKFPAETRKSICQECVNNTPEKIAKVRTPSLEMKCSQCNLLKPKIERKNVIISNKSICKDCHENNWENMSSEDKFFKCIKSNLSGAKSRAKIKGLGFNIKESDFEYSSTCPILGIEYSYLENIDFAPSLDRVDNSIGYEKGNVKIISRKANKLKSDASIEDIENLLAYMKNNP